MPGARHKYAGRHVKVKNRFRKVYEVTGKDGRTRKAYKSKSKTTGKVTWRKVGSKKQEPGFDSI